MKNKIIIFGGSFNPITTAHFNILKCAMAKINASKAIFLPTGDMYNKSDLLDFKHRFNMLNIICANEKNFEVNDYENRFETNPKALMSLNYFRSIYPDSELYFMMGKDNFINFDKWYQPESILSNYHIIVIDRDSNVKNFNHQFMKFNDKITFIESTLDNYLVSSSIVRSLFKENKNDEAFKLVDKQVYDYIINNNLY